MLRSGVKNTILLFLVIFSSINQIYQCSSINTDNFYEDNYDKRELANEIDELNEYMQMVADQLSNDGVIVVRATRTIFKNPDVGNESVKFEPENQIALGDMIAANLEEEETVASVKLDNELFCKYENLSLIDEQIFHMKESGVTKNEIPFEIKHFEESSNENDKTEY